uniref:Uncharacterized protein n=1 Tax=Homalodisca liturata TaxID=320908 RepID=A0A1B6HYD0_9HEMI
MTKLVSVMRIVPIMSNGVVWTVAMLAVWKNTLMPTVVESINMLAVVEPITMLAMVGPVTMLAAVGSVTMLAVGTPLVPAMMLMLVTAILSVLDHRRRFAPGVDDRY